MASGGFPPTFADLVPVTRCLPAAPHKGAESPAVPSLGTDAAMDLQSYQTDGFWDELFDVDLRPRPGAEQLVRRLAAFSHGELADRQKAADKALLTMGITFNVYGHEAGTGVVEKRAKARCGFSVTSTL